MTDRLRTIWKGMRARCLNSARPEFPNYGGRGISVCREWSEFDAFREWAVENGFREDRQIDRINADGDYTPDNCRWILPATNSARRWLPRDGRYLADLDGRLTETAIDAAQSRAMPYKLTDGLGLYVFVSPSGSKSYRYKFRFGGKEKLLTLGRHPDLTLIEARELRLAAATRLKAGRDPAATKVESKRRRERNRRR